MTVIDGKVWPDGEFPEEVFGYHANRNSVHNYRTPFQTEQQVRKSVKDLKTDPNTYRLRIARYKLVEVKEIECAGERPESNADET